LKLSARLFFCALSFSFTKTRCTVHEPGSPLLPSRFEGALAEGASVRLLAPQKHHDLLWALMAGLEDNFGAMVGANAYLTPSGEQVSQVYFWARALCKKRGRTPHNPVLICQIVKRLII